MNNEDFPWLDCDEYYPFPSRQEWKGDVVGTGGNLSPGMLLSAYAQGIFPWFNPDEEILWWSLDPRFILYFDHLKVSRSMKKVIRSRVFTITMDQAFQDVVDSCGKILRLGQKGSWIGQEIQKAYCYLHNLGFAHSVEVWEGRELAGGLYGISLGNVFFGESMFSKKSNASKTALIALCSYLQDKKFSFIDCQQPTDHLGSMGAVKVKREVFLAQLEASLGNPAICGNWSLLFPDFPSSKLWNALLSAKGGGC